MKSGAGTMITTRNCNIRILRKAKTLIAEDARLLVEGITHPFNRHHGIPGSMPRSTRKWLSNLSPQTRARVQILSAATADHIYSKSGIWRNFEKAGAVLCGTILAYPNPGQNMPAYLEYESVTDQGQKYIRRIDTRAYQGLPNIALAFNRAKILVEYTNNTYIEKIYPRGEIVVLNDFPQRTDEYMIPENGEMIGTPGEERYLIRKALAWIGNIVRSSTEKTIRNPHDTIFACHKPDRKFGVLVELPPEEPKKEEPEQTRLCFQPTQEIRLLPEKSEVQEEPEPRELDIQEKARLRRIIGECVMQYFTSMGKLENAALEKTLGKEFVGIAKGNGLMQQELLELVNLAVFTEFESQAFLIDRGMGPGIFTLIPNYLIPRPGLIEIKETSDRICSALGIPPGIG